MLSFRNLRSLQSTVFKSQAQLCQFYFGSSTLKRIGTLTSSKTFTQEDVDSFAKLSGDFNPIHVNSEESNKPIVHGVLILGHVSGMIASELSGAKLYKLNIDFKSPLNVGEEILLKATTKSLEKSLLIMRIFGWSASDSREILNGEVDIALTKHLLRSFKNEQRQDAKNETAV